MAAAGPPIAEAISGGNQSRQKERRGIGPAGVPLTKALHSEGATRRKEIVCGTVEQQRRYTQRQFVGACGGSRRGPNGPGARRFARARRTTPRGCGGAAGRGRDADRGGRRGDDGIRRGRGGGAELSTERVGAYAAAGFVCVAQRAVGGA